MLTHLILFCSAMATDVRLSSSSFPHCFGTFFFFYTWTYSRICKPEHVRSSQDGIFNVFFFCFLFLWSTTTAQGFLGEKAAMASASVSFLGRIRPDFGFLASVPFFGLRPGDKGVA